MPIPLKSLSLRFLGFRFCQSELSQLFVKRISVDAQFIGGFGLCLIAGLQDLHQQLFLNRFNDIIVQIICSFFCFT